MSITPEEQQDNLEVAMDKVAETLEPTRSRLVGKKKKDKDGTDLSSTAQEQVLFRATAEDKQKWEECAKHLGISMAEFLRVSANEKVETAMAGCDHPLAFRRSYPWMEECLKCGVRLRNEETATYTNKR
jgi:hypothetical protein